jgi:hypothetical protein
LSSIVLELCGTFAEVYTADVLLQGRTNLDDFIITIRWCLGLCGCASSKTTDNKVHSQQSIEKDTKRKRRTTFNHASAAAKNTKLERRTTFNHASAGEENMKIERKTSFDHETATDKKRHQRMIFCATVMIINTITEASGLVVGSLFWICCNAKPSTPGGGGIELSQAMINLVIMLFGELVLSDSVVAYVSYKLSSRYVISIAHEWEDFWEKRRQAIIGLVAILSFLSCGLILKISDRFCLTSIMPHEEDWTLTQCIDLTDELRGNIRNLVRVDDMFLTEDGAIDSPWGD